jgi:hypothetical protein
MTQTIKVTTKFDITATGVRSHYRESLMPFATQQGTVIQDQASWNRARNQQRNWETINQVISLRCLPERIQEPRQQDGAWSFEFDVPSLEAVSRDLDPVGWLVQDAQGVPMITGLSENAVDPAWLQTSGKDANCWFELVVDK